jgi:WD40 repeat protein
MRVSYRVAAAAVAVMIGCTISGCASTPGRDRALDPVMAVALSIDGQTMAVSTPTTDVALFDLSPLRFRVLLTPDEGRTLSWKEAQSRPGVTALFRSPPVAFSPNGKQLVAAGARGELVGWEVETRSVTFRAPWEPGMVGLAFFPDGRSFATVGHAARHWSAESGSALGEFKVPGDATATSLAISPDGGILLVGLSSGEIVEFATSTRQALRVMKGHSAPVTGIAFSPDGSAFASTAGRFDPRLWNTRDDSPLPVRLTELGGVGESLNKSAQETSGLMFFAWLLGTSRGFQIVGAPTMGPPPSGRGPTVEQASKETSPYCDPEIAYSPDGRYLATTAQLSMLSGEFHLVVVDLVHKTARVINGIYGCAVAFSGDSNFAITGGLGAPQVWNAETGTRVDEVK